VTVGPFFGDHMIDLPAAEVMAESGALEDALIAADEALKELPEVVLGAEDGERFRMGQAVQAGAQPANAVLLRVYGPPQGKDFLGVGEVAGDGRIAPKRVFAKR
jgi:tRNA U55 pseudouridine synthase TruB